MESQRGICHPLGLGARTSQRSLPGGGPHTISLGDRVSHRHFEKQLTKKNEGLGKSVSQSVSPVKSHSRRRPTDRQNDKMIEQLPPRRHWRFSLFEGGGGILFNLSFHFFTPLFHRAALLSMTKRGRRGWTKKASRAHRAGRCENP